MRTLVDAAIVVGFCASVWLVIRPVTRRWAGHPVRQLALYATAAAVTSAAAVGLGAWHQHDHPTVASVAVTAGGMVGFWALVRLQTAAPREEPEPAAEPPAPTMTRRERREARRRFGRGRRNGTTPPANRPARARRRRRRAPSAAA